MASEEVTHSVLKSLPERGTATERVYCVEEGPSELVPREPFGYPAECQLSRFAEVAVQCGSDLEGEIGQEPAERSGAPAGIGSLFAIKSN